MKKLRDFEQNGGLSSAERTLVEAIRAETVARLSDQVPSEPSDAVSVRAEFLRYLAQGGCDECRPGPRGITFAGAYVAEPLDLIGCTVPQPFVAIGCSFRGGVTMMDARTRLFSLDQCRLYTANDGDKDALAADRAKVEGNFTIRDSQAYGAVRLAGMEILGQLALNDTYINTHKAFDAEEFEGLFAIEMTSTTVLGDAFFSDLRASGTSRFNSSKFHGDVFLNRAIFNNPRGLAVDFEGAQIVGELSAVQPATEDDRIIPIFNGRADFSRCDVNFFRDGVDTIQNGDRLVIEGMTYRRINMHGIELAARIEWLKKAAEVLTRDGKRQFRPQPWTQFISYLRSQGEAGNARKVGIQMERERRRLGGVPGWFNRRIHAIYGILVDYGYSPIAKPLFYAAVFVTLGAFVAGWSWREGVMAPAQVAVLDDQAWLDCAASPSLNAAECWAAGLPGRDYETFHPLLYSFDVFLPIVTVEQEPSWAPSTSRGRALAEVFLTAEGVEALREVPLVGAPLAHWFETTTTGGLVWTWRFVHEVLGYLISAFAVAGAARLVRE